MKYKVGDRVKLKRDMPYDHNIREFLENIDYTVTIYAIGRDGYRIKPLPWQYIGWHDYNIECLCIEPIYDSIENRFELMDFD